MELHAVSKLALVLATGWQGRQVQGAGLQFRHHFVSHDLPVTDKLIGGYGLMGLVDLDKRGVLSRQWAHHSMMRTSVNSLLRCLAVAFGVAHSGWAGDLPPKVPQGNGGIFMWVTDPQKYDYWRKTLQWKSAFEMQYLHDFLASLEWWRLEPAHDLIRNQPNDIMHRMVLAKSAAGDLAVAYLPGNEGIEIEMSAFPAPLTARWFDPVHGRYTPISGNIENKGTRHLSAPATGDWVLLLQHLAK